jgi:hypothetical protein
LGIKAGDYRAGKLHISRIVYNGVVGSPKSIRSRRVKSCRNSQTTLYRSI